MWIQRTLPDIPLIWVGSAAFSKKLLNCEGNCWRRSFRRRGSLHEFRSSLHLSSGTNLNVVMQVRSRSRSSDDC